MSRGALAVIEPGLLPYREALGWQRALAQARIAGTLENDVLLLVEHPAVVTCGRSARPAHILDGSGIDVVEVERGGDVTYHGPGQLVGYPILDLSRHRPDLHWYLRALEQTLIDALGGLGIPARRQRPHTGVWTGDRKIASIGVHVKQWVTWHGFALNVTTDLSGFARIVPCGIAGVTMTSVARERGDDPNAAALLRQTSAAVVAAFARTFDLAVTADALAVPVAGRPEPLPSER
jgi:lipoyl(octanoyl) transferase